MASHRTIVALMPMKAHSERVPKKNFRPLGDRPLFRWVLDTMLSIDEITKVVINTTLARFSPTTDSRTGRECRYGTGVRRSAVTRSA